MPAKTSGQACGSSTTSVCDGADTCDGAGRCLANLAPSTKACNDGIFCNGADQCNGAGTCVHAGNVCAAPKLCFESTQSCACSTTNRVHSYCGPGDEATDRAAVDAARAACQGCAGGSTDNYTRVGVNGCQEFYCKP
jgi:hypothetical protein